MWGGEQGSAWETFPGYLGRPPQEGQALGFKLTATQEGQADPCLLASQGCLSPQTRLTPTLPQFIAQLLQDTAKGLSNFGEAAAGDQGKEVFSGPLNKGPALL